jgi:hypothetical protein
MVKLLVETKTWQLACLSSLRHLGCNLNVSGTAIMTAPVTRDCLSAGDITRLQNLMVALDELWDEDHEDLLCYIIPGETYQNI